MKSKITRRDFISGLIRGSISAGLAAASGSSLACRSSIKSVGDFDNIFKSGDNPLLIIIRGMNIDKIIEKGLSLLLESAQRKIKTDKLFIKPNATGNEPYPVTTDIALLRKTADFFRNYGMEKITVSDNPSYWGILTRKIFKDQGYFTLKKEAGVKVLPRDPGIGFTYRKIRNPRWKENPVIMVNKDIVEADLFINTAIPKRHHEADFTCALKNNFGSIYDPFRTQAHIRMETDKEKGQDFFDRTIVECADAARPHINIIDARSILIKSGPGLRAGGVVQDEVNEVIFSGDMVAADAYCSELMERYDNSFNPRKRIKKQLNYAQELGLGIADLSKIEILELSL